ncbi:MAG: acyl-CoA thioesterase [Bacteroidetes bacterium]|nr:acyl-CoA thioesterase [Bacteroidota bacterium]MCB0802115.1 acyl-CoA thioesterase [Flavobacteriales bacterium]NOG57798.1 acyl-CoA thioesterase [Bacteroidota bacterium]
MKEIDLTKFKHVTEVKVRFMDIDALQHVNNARYLNFLEEARISYSQDILNLFSKVNQFNILVARIEIDYMRPIFYNTTVKIYTRVQKIGTKSFVFESVICVVKEEEKLEIVSRALQTLVCFDPKTNKTVMVSDEIRNAIEKYESN